MVMQKQGEAFISYFYEWIGLNQKKDQKTSKNQGNKFKKLLFSFFKNCILSSSQMKKSSYLTKSFNSLNTKIQ